jgi:hypothetical protein
MEDSESFPSLPFSLVFSCLGNSAFDPLLVLYFFVIFFSLVYGSMYLRQKPVGYGQLHEKGGGGEGGE